MAAPRCFRMRPPMETSSSGFVRAGTFKELQAKGRLVVHGRHRPVLVVYDRGKVLALDNRCPHMGFPLERGSIEDGILTCHCTTHVLHWQMAVPSICGLTMCQPVRS